MTRSPFATPSDFRRVGELADFAVQLLVGQRARIAGLALPDDRGLVAAVGQVPVEAVVAGVELPADEPLGVRGVRPVEHLRPRLEPVQRLAPARPRTHRGRARAHSVRRSPARRRSRSPWPTNSAGGGKRRVSFRTLVMFFSVIGHWSLVISHGRFVYRVRSLAHESSSLNQSPSISGLGITDRAPIDQGLMTHDNDHFTIAAVQMKIAPDRETQPRQGRGGHRRGREARRRRSSACRSSSPAITSARRKTRRSSISPSRSPGRSEARLAAAAKANKVVVVGSLFEKRMAGVYHNTATVHDAERQLARPLPQDAHPGRPALPGEVLLHPGRPRLQGFHHAARRRSGRSCAGTSGTRRRPGSRRCRGRRCIFYPTAIGWHPREKAEFGEAQHAAWETSMRGHAIANGTYVVRGQSRRARGHRRRGAGVLGRGRSSAIPSAAS